MHFFPELKSPVNLFYFEFYQILLIRFNQLEFDLLCSEFHKAMSDFFIIVLGDYLPNKMNVITHDNKSVEFYFIISN